MKQMLSWQASLGRTHKEGSHVKEGWEENLEKALLSAKCALEEALFSWGQ